MTNVYFFSRHEATDEMKEALGGEITEQFRGTISQVHREEGKIVFLETLSKESEKCREVRIESNGILVLVGPLPLQDSFLRAGATTLLIPQNRREIGGNGQVIFKYSGLIQVHEIKVVTSQWHGREKTYTERVSERMDFLKTQ